MNSKKKSIINSFKLKLYVLFIISLFLSIILFILFQEKIEDYIDNNFIEFIVSCIIPSIILSILSTAYLRIKDVYVSGLIFLKIYVYNFFILILSIFFGFIFFIIAAFSTDSPTQSELNTYLIFITPSLITFFILIIAITKPFINHLLKSMRYERMKKYKKSKQI